MSRSWRRSTWRDLLVFRQEFMKRVKKQVVEANMAIPQARAHPHISKVQVMKPIQKRNWEIIMVFSTRAHGADPKTNGGEQHGDSTRTGAASQGAW